MLQIVLHQPEIPQNTGNIARTCVAIRAKLWLVRPLGFRVDDHHMRRAGLDYWQHLDWDTVDSWDEFEQSYVSENAWFFTKMATQIHFDVSYRVDDILVFGSETQGLPKSILERFSDRCVKIPTSDNVRSLNLSNAVAVGGYEAVRQCRGGKRNSLSHPE